MLKVLDEEKPEDGSQASFEAETKARSVKHNG
jgi:hypothetical protein